MGLESIQTVGYSVFVSFHSANWVGMFVFLLRIFDTRSIYILFSVHHNLIAFCMDIACNQTNLYPSLGSSANSVMIELTIGLVEMIEGNSDSINLKQQILVYNLYLLVVLQMKWILLYNVFVPLFLSCKFHTCMI